MVILISCVGKMRLGAVICLGLRGEDAADKPREVFHLLLESCCVSKHAQAGLWNSSLFLSHGLIETTDKRKIQIQSMYSSADSLHKLH